MLRRDFFSFLGGAVIAGPRVAIAQTPSKVYRVGTLLPGPPVDEKSPLGAVLLQKLEQQGYTLGKNLAFEARGAGGQVSKLGEIVRGMKADQVDVIVAGGFPVALACKVANVPTVVYIGVAILLRRTLLTAWRILAATSPAFPITRRLSPPNASH
jgi:putative ABC transport system substrate-binding protein